MEIPAEVLSKLKCYDCNNYLSRAPVYMRENQNRICGFCATPADKIRNTLYEDLAQLMLFPCKNQIYGCQQNLRFNDESDHEIFCEFREAVCPFLEYENCKWIGGNIDIYKHCQEEHGEKFLTNVAEYEVATENFEYLLISAFEKIFILRIKICESRNIFHSMNCLDEYVDTSNYNYDLLVLDKSFKNIQISSAMKIVTLRNILSDFELELNINNALTNQTVSVLLYNPVSTQNRWSTMYDENKMMCPNCNFFDIKTKVDKHVWHFCKDGRSCAICSKDITESSIDEHRSSEHSDIILENGAKWETPLSEERRWRIISSDVGDLLCSYEIGVLGIEVKVISPLTRRQMRKYTCFFEICGFNVRKELDVQKNEYIDWHTLIDNDEVDTDNTKMFNFKFEICKKK